VLDRVGAVADEVFIVATDRPAYAQFGVPVYPDRYGETGALGGIASAIAQAAHGACLVVSCDAPFLNVDLLRWMAARPRDYDVLVPRLGGASRQGGRLVYQTLHAIYARRCLPAIARALDAGRLQIISFFDDVDVTVVEEDVVRGFDPSFTSFVSVNTPESLSAARAKWLELGAGGGGPWSKRP
jgi:molybdopterin-guanine dinucleotide biosynthesis protein A